MHAVKDNCAAPAVECRSAGSCGSAGRYMSRHSGPNADSALSAMSSRRRAGDPLRVGPRAHSHSMVPGGLEVMSRTTRFTSGTSPVIRLEIRASRS